MTQAPHLMIVTLMLPQGTTGVQTHFNAIAQYAATQDVRISIIEPHQFNRWIRKIPGAINRLLNRINLEWAVLVNRVFVYYFLKSLLKNALIAAKRESVVVYAQDPLSARVALDLRREGFQFRLVGVVHFNISEAQEFLEKNIASENGKLWRSLMTSERDALPGLDQIVFVSSFMQRVVGARLPELKNVPQAVISNFPAMSGNSALRSDNPLASHSGEGRNPARTNTPRITSDLAGVVCQLSRVASSSISGQNSGVAPLSRRMFNQLDSGLRRNDKVLDNGLSGLSKTNVSGDMIAIGTLEARKNQTYLLRVLAECNAMGKRYTLTMVGDGPDRAALEQQVANLGLAGQVQFLGFQPDAARLIPGHRAFVHAARMENLPITLLEALRAAVPVFAAPVGGIPEVFNDGDEGHYLNLDDPHDAAEKLASTLEDQHKWQCMSICARGTYISRFHPDVLGKRWLNTLLGNARP